MKHATLTIVFLLVFSTKATSENLDSLMLRRMFSYQRNFTQDANGFSTNVYAKFLYQTNHRNLLMWTVPYGYSIAGGERNFVSEQYSRLTFNDMNDYKNNRQVYYTTIPHNRRTMPILLEFLTPNLYHVTLYGDHVLSPFNRENLVYYHYDIHKLDDYFVRIKFRPRFFPNTQLVNGQALVEYQTGRIDQIELNGEFDMIRFRTQTTQGYNGKRALMPHFLQTDIQFKFMGNDITSHFEALYDCPITLPDTLHVIGNRHLIDSIRPIVLSATETAIYKKHDKRNTIVAKAEEKEEDTDSIPQKTAPKEHNYWEEIGWDMIGSNLIRSISTENDKASFKLYPLLNPQYISFSARKGFSYQMKAGIGYKFNNQTSISFVPQLGYNFKQHEFYYTLPFELKYDQLTDGRIYAKLQKDNRIGNSTVINEIKDEFGELEELNQHDLDLFRDTHFSVKNMISPKSWLTLEAGFIYHHRKAVNPYQMSRFGKSTEYNSLAPAIGVKVRPWKKAPIFSVDYERGLKTRFSDLLYERWEADMSYKHSMPHLQQLNLRFGGGFYTAKNINYFMDFTNFRENNLPEGWDDDWSGNFQLLASEMYNASDYYLRSNISYESPLLAVSMIPLVGRYVERERAYLNSLSIAHSRIYSELGYGFTCRYFSMALFASFLNIEYQRMGCKFTFELFRRW